MIDAKYSTKSTTKPKWLLPFILGIAITLIGWAAFRIMNPPIDSHLAAIAEKRNYDPRTYSDVMQLVDKADKAGDLSDRDWHRLMEIFKDPNPIMREHAVAAMMGMKRSPRRNEILSMVRPLLQSEEPGLQSGALILLWRFNDPSWRSEAVQRKNHPDESIRYAVGLILHKGDRPQSQ